MKNLLLLHGALASKNQFNNLISLLKNDFNADAINLSGHGGTPIDPLGYHFSVFANDILRHIDSKQIEKVNLFGYSMGGYAALSFAKLYPDRVERIFTLNVKFNWDKNSTEKEVSMLNADNLLAKVPHFADNLIRQHGEEKWKNVLNQTGEMMRNLAVQPFLTDSDIKNIIVPTLLGIGDKDETSSIEETLEIHRKISDSQLLVIPNTKHPFEKINTELLCLFIKKFFI